MPGRPAARRQAMVRGHSSAVDCAAGPTATVVQRRSMEDVLVTDVLGEGAISTVARCRHAGHPAELALKMYHRERMSEAQCKQAGPPWRMPRRACTARQPDTAPLQVLHEVEVHAQLDHPGIVPLYAAFQDEDGIFLVQALEPGKSVAKLVHGSGGYLSEDRAASAVMQPLLSALCYLHGKVRPLRHCS